MQTVIRRQAHGIKAQSITITLPADELVLLRREAHAKGITPSRHIVDLIRLARSMQAAMAPQPVAAGGE